MNKNILIYILLFIIFLLSYKYYKLYNYTIKLDNNKDEFNNVIFPFNFLLNKNKISNHKDKKKIVETNLNVEKDKKTNCYLIDSDDDDIYINKIYNENTYEELFNNNFTILVNDEVKNKDDSNINNINNLTFEKDDNIINNLTFEKDDNNINILTYEKDDNNINILTFEKNDNNINSLIFEKNDNSLIFEKDNNLIEDEKINNIKINIQYLEKQIKPLKNIKFKNLN